ncbi:MAG TPA: hypothetical protein VN345_00580 [Blastocatellia bacterium]|jgi:hypothetical protein|nr:hypothetical protein [Blastocatellia bacterium]
MVVGLRALPVDCPRLEESGIAAPSPRQRGIGSILAEFFQAEFFQLASFERWV